MSDWDAEDAVARGANVNGGGRFVALSFPFDFDTTDADSLSLALPLCEELAVPDLRLLSPFVLSL
jgi:hypothetical protein